MWYNEGMTQEIITTPDVVQTAKRIIASSLAAHGEKEVPYQPDADRKTKQRDILATILWDIVTTGTGFLADGTAITPEGYSE